MHERRYLSLPDLGNHGLYLEQRDGEPAKIRGIAPPWDSMSVDLGGFREKFASTAFDKILARHKNDPRGPVDVVGLFNHEDSAVLSRTTNGSLRLAKEARGLGFEMSPLPDTQTGRDVQTLVRDGLVYGASFAFTVKPDGEQWTADEKGNPIRTIHEASGLYDVSVVTRPAYPTSSVGLRSLERWKECRSAVHATSDARLTISLDYDQTFTAAPGLWRSFVADATGRGNRIVCISRRADDEANRTEIRDAMADLEVSAFVLCGPDTQKRAAAAAAGIEVDVWIDDYPEGIVEPRAYKVSTLAGARAAAAAAAARMRIHAG